MESSPSDSQLSIPGGADDPIEPIAENENENENQDKDPHSLGKLGNDNVNVKNEHYMQPDIKGIKLFSRKSRKATKNFLQPFEGWEQPPDHRPPYHQYVHDLVQAGWDGLKSLDDYMSVDIEDQELAISVLDIGEDFKLKQWPDMHDFEVLARFMDEESRAGVKVRLYMTEQQGRLAAGVMEAFGSSSSGVSEEINTCWKPRLDIGRHIQALVSVFRGCPPRQEPMPRNSRSQYT